MVLASDRVSRGMRVQEIQRACGYGEGPRADNAGFAERLNEAAVELGLDSDWTVSKLSKIRHGTQGMSIEDATVIAYLDGKQRGWTWVAFNVAVGIGEDPYATLAKQAKKKRAG